MEESKEPAFVQPSIVGEAPLVLEENLEEIF